MLRYYLVLLFSNILCYTIIRNTSITSVTRFKSYIALNNMLGPIVLQIMLLLLLITSKSCYHSQLLLFKPFYVCYSPHVYFSICFSSQT